MIQGKTMTVAPLQHVVMASVPIEPFYHDSHSVIYNADCRKVLPFLEVLDLVLTDPPYGINATKMTMGKGQSSKPKSKRFNNSSWDENVPRNLNQVLDAAKYACIWGGNYMTQFLEPTNDWLVWHKKNDDRSFSECEFAWTNFGCQSRHLSHHWGGEQKSHPTQKPLDVIRWCFRWVPEDVQTVIDPFMGSGTTLVAAKAEGRFSVGIELELEHCKTAVKRLAQGTLL